MTDTTDAVERAAQAMFSRVDDRSWSDPRIEQLTKDEWRDLAQVALATPKAVSGEVERLRKVLEPFSREAENYDYGDDGEPDLKGAPDASSLNEINDLTVGDLRRAREAIRALSPVDTDNSASPCDLKPRGFHDA